MARQDDPTEPTPGAVLETLERLFDKGVVVDPWARAMPEAIDLVAENRHVVVASVETFSERAEPGSGADRGV